MFSPICDLSNVQYSEQEHESQSQFTSNVEPLEKWSYQRIWELTGKCLFEIFEMIRKTVDSAKNLAVHTAHQ